VQALTAHNTAEVEKLRLFQQMGIQQPGAVRLTSTFAVSKPTFSLDSVLDVARAMNPAVKALRERERASGWNVRMAQSAYTPTLFLATGWGGTSFRYTDSDFPVAQRLGQIEGQRAGCFFEDSIRARTGMPAGPTACNSFVLTPSQEQAIRDRNNNQFPFRFTRSPLSLFAQLSLPVFDNFAREERVETAQVARDNARYNVRARELQLSADVTQAYLNLTTAARTVELQEVNAQKAREELTYAQERYRVGAATFLDVTTSNATYVQAQVDRLNAIYDYHRFFAALEAAVGRPLR
jgi:outer membrane protein